METIAAFGFLSRDVENGIDELHSFRIMSFCPVVCRARVSKNEVVRAEGLEISSYLRMFPSNQPTPPKAYTDRLIRPVWALQAIFEF